MFEKCLTSNIKTYLREYGSNLSGNARRTTVSNWCSPPYLHNILRGRVPLLVLRNLLARSSAVECPAVNRVVGSSNLPVPVLFCVHGQIGSRHRPFESAIVGSNPTGRIAINASALRVTKIIYYLHRGAWAPSHQREIVVIR